MTVKFNLIKISITKDILKEINIKTLEIIQDQKKKNKDKMSIKEETIKETFNGKVQIKEALDNGEVTWLPTKMKEEIKQFHKTIKDPI